MKKSQSIISNLVRFIFNLIKFFNKIKYYQIKYSQMTFLFLNYMIYTILILLFLLFFKNLCLILTLLIPLLFLYNFFNWNKKFQITFFTSKFFYFSSWISINSFNSSCTFSYRYTFWVFFIRLLLLLLHQHLAFFQFYLLEYLLHKKFHHLYFQKAII